MKHLVVVAHPAADSFTMGLARAYAGEVERIGHSQRICDLYRMGFNPVLAAAEIGPDHAVCTDVAEAQDALRAADVLAVFYPLWWMSMPAMLKGYVDRVFARGFAYESRDGVVHGLLSGRQAVLVTVSGAPLPVLKGSGKWDAVQILQDTHIFRNAGFEVLEHLHVDEVTPRLSAAIAEQHMERVRACVRLRFG